MQRTEPRFVVLAILLAALAGFVDALAYTSLGGFFASFMSGNSTRLGVGLGTGVPADAMMAAALILAFLSGVIVATVVSRAVPARAQTAVLTLVTLLLLAGAVLAQVAAGPTVLLLLAAAMGAENGMFARDGEVAIGLTYMTGSLVRAGQRLAGALMGDADRWSWAPWLLLWAGFVAGVVLGAEAEAALHWDALWIAVLAAAGLTAAAESLRRGGIRTPPIGAAPGN